MRKKNGKLLFGRASARSWNEAVTESGLCKQRAQEREYEERGGFLAGTAAGGLRWRSAVSIAR